MSPWFKHLWSLLIWYLWSIIHFFKIFPVGNVYIIVYNLFMSFWNSSIHQSFDLLHFFLSNICLCVIPLPILITCLIHCFLLAFIIPVMFVPWQISLGFWFVRLNCCLQLFWLQRFFSGPLFPTPNFTWNIVLYIFIFRLVLRNK